MRMAISVRFCTLGDAADLVLVMPPRHCSKLGGGHRAAATGLITPAWAIMQGEGQAAIGPTHSALFSFATQSGKQAAEPKQASSYFFERYSTEAYLKMVPICAGPISMRHCEHVVSLESFCRPPRLVMGQGTWLRPSGRPMMAQQYCFEYE